MMTINFDTIANNYEVIYVIKTAFIDQRLPNLVQRLFANVIYDAIWLMNIHEQKYLWFLAMIFLLEFYFKFISILHRVNN